MSGPELFLDPDRCPVCGFRPRKLLPNDGVRTVRALPRHWHDVLTQVASEDAGERLIRQPLGAGPSAAGHAALVAEALRQAAHQLRVLRTDDRPTLDGPCPPDTAPPADDTTPTESLIGVLADEADRLVAQAEGIRGHDWLRTGTRADREVTALEVLRRAVHEGTHRLEETTRGLARLRAAEAARRRCAEPNSRSVA